MKIEVWFRNPAPFERRRKCEHLQKIFGVLVTPATFVAGIQILTMMNTRNGPLVVNALAIDFFIAALCYIVGYGRRSLLMNAIAVWLILIPFTLLMATNVYAWSMNVNFYGTRGEFIFALVTAYLLPALVVLGFMLQEPL